MKIALVILLAGTSLCAMNKVEKEMGGVDSSIPTLEVLCLKKIRILLANKENKVTAEESIFYENILGKTPIGNFAIKKLFEDSENKKGATNAEIFGEIKELCVQVGECPEYVQFKLLERLRISRQNGRDKKLKLFKKIPIHGFTRIDKICKVPSEQGVVIMMAKLIELGEGTKVPFIKKGVSCAVDPQPSIYVD